MTAGKNAWWTNVRNEANSVAAARRVGRTPWSARVPMDPLLAQ
jgi:hypothetical protein